jgi:DNA-binding TFAR19-related protein (PDSD5 family)
MDVSWTYTTVLRRGPILRPVSNRFMATAFGGKTTMEEDADLKLLEQRKLEEIRRRLKATPPTPKQEKTDRQVVEGALYDRGDEVLDAAYSFYPNETERLVRELADLIRAGKLRERIAGGELLSIFRQLGLRFSLKTSIKVMDQGKLVDLSEKLGKKD